MLFSCVMVVLRVRRSLCAEGALIVYISRGLLSSIVDARGILEAIAVGNGRLGHRVVINTYAIINSEWSARGTDSRNSPSVARAPGILLPSSHLG